MCLPLHFDVCLVFSGFRYSVSPWSQCLRSPTTRKHLGATVHSSLPPCLSDASTVPPLRKRRDRLNLLMDPFFSNCLQCSDSVNTFLVQLYLSCPNGFCPCAVRPVYLICPVLCKAKQWKRLWLHAANVRGIQWKLYCAIPDLRLIVWILLVLMRYLII